MSQPGFRSAPITVDDPTDPNDPFEPEIAEYHRRQKPKENADILYIRIEQTGT